MELKIEIMCSGAKGEDFTYFVLLVKEDIALDLLRGAKTTGAIITTVLFEQLAEVIARFEGYETVKITEISRACI